jgi:hypothetical protein
LDPDNLCANPRAIDLFPCPDALAATVRQSNTKMALAAANASVLGDGWPPTTGKYDPIEDFPEQHLRHKIVVSPSRL